MQTETNELLAIARRYCTVIESLDDGNREPLAQLNEILPRLHAAMARLPTQEEGSYDANVDLDQRFELFSRLHRLLGDLDGYWMEYDVTPDRQEMSGSLADDLTDIYCELKNGLKRLDGSDDTGRTLGRWRTGFCKHWGQHVVDAERHLYALSARDRLY
jgi:hypothetical protein